MMFFEALRELEMQELKHSEESKNAPLVERCDAEELATFFGLPWDKHEYAKTPQDVQKGMKTGLVSFLFSRSVGDQLAKVLDGLRQDKAAKKANTIPSLLGSFRFCICIQYNRCV